MSAPTAAPTPDVAVVILSWNGRDETLRCLASLQGAVPPPRAVIVIDNASVDGSADAVERSFPDVTVVRLDHNAGFSGGVNAGIDAALRVGASAVMLLNNDMVVEEGFLEPLVAALHADPSVAAACSQVLFDTDPPRIWYAGASFHPRRGHHGRNIGFGESPRAGIAPYPVDCACGGAMLIPRTAFETVGRFDEGLFAYREDLDWSLRARRAGFQIAVVPASIVRHRVSASTGGESSPSSLYYDLRNLLVVTERNAPASTLWTWSRRLEAVGAHAAQALLSTRRRDGLRAVWDGWRDFRAGRDGPRAGFS